ncbi:MAG: hypothetical protein A3J75_00330 [Acidobacteria bacterium RBG_16_68_9]|nr:MAG: hypothetical protein A3J75_00330 [Acidobacteria bacterium RBG_16_68_9]
MTAIDERSREHLAAIFGAAVAAVDPARLVQDHLQRDGAFVCVHEAGRDIVRWRGMTLVVGAGKAAERMASGCEAALGPDRVHGLVIAADRSRLPVSSIAVTAAGHPVPDRRGLEATRRLCDLSAGARIPTICLISGGASSLLVRPRDPVSLRDKMAVSRLLLACGADIASMNTVRKHLSTVKGGGLLRLARGRPLVGMILSDVVGDEPSVIGSGPTVPDPTTYGDASQVLSRFAIESKVPAPVRRLLAQGASGRAPETVKPGDVAAHAVTNLVVGTNRIALAAAAMAARRLGYEVVVAPEPLIGDTTTAARRWADSILRRARQGATRPLCFLAGGETTVVVSGHGRGGRNQEFALALAGELAGGSIAVLSAGTDGIDGPTDAAGAFVDGSTLARVNGLGLDANAALRENDSYSLFGALGDLFVCGPTGTNVMDIKIALARSKRSTAKASRSAQE